jgi:hypothetical protein
MGGAEGIGVDDGKDKQRQKQQQQQRQRQKQIPFGDDNQINKCNDNGKGRSPSGMTTK